jgi:hypothetical protein
MVLPDMNGGTVAGDAQDAPGNDQLEGHGVVQEHRPGDEEFDVGAERQGAAGIEEDATAR